MIRERLAGHRGSTKRLVVSAPFNAGRHARVRVRKRRITSYPAPRAHRVLDAEIRRGRGGKKKKQAQVVSQHDAEHHEKKEKQPVAHAPHATAPVVETDYPRIVWLTGFLNQYRPQIAPPLAQHVGKATRGQRYVIIMSEPLWVAMVGKPRMEQTVESMRSHAMDPSRNPVIGFRNLSWTLVGISAASLAAVFWGGILVAGSPFALPAAAGGAGAAGSGATAITLEQIIALGARAANDNAVRAITAAAAAIAIALTTKSAAAGEPTIDAVDDIVALPIEKLSGDERAALSDGSEVSFLGKTFYHWARTGAAAMSKPP